MPKIYKSEFGCKGNKYFLYKQINIKKMETILSFQTKIGDVTYEIKTLKEPETRFYYTRIELINHNSKIIETTEVSSTNEKTVLKLAYEEIKNIIS